MQALVVMQVAIVAAIAYRIAIPRLTGRAWAGWGTAFGGLGGWVGGVGGRGGRGGRGGIVGSFWREAGPRSMAALQVMPFLNDKVGRLRALSGRGRKVAGDRRYGGHQRSV